MTALEPSAREARLDGEVAAAIALSSRTFRRGKRGRDALVRGLQALSLVLTLGVWEWLAGTGLLNPLFFSRPTAIAQFLVDNSASLFGDALVTLQATIVGFAVGSVAGVAAAFLIAAVPVLDRVLQPWISVLMSIPRVALAPLFLLWFGITETSKVALAVSIVFFMVLVSTAAGLKSIPPDLDALGRAFHASPWQRFRTILLPACVPSIFAGLRLGVVTSILGVVSSEMVASSSGLGQKVVLYGQNFNSAGVFSVLVLLAVITTAMTALVVWVEQRLLRWQRV